MNVASAMEYSDRGENLDPGWIRYPHRAEGIKEGRAKRAGDWEKEEYNGRARVGLCKMPGPSRKGRAFCPRLLSKISQGMKVVRRRRYREK